MTRTNPDAPLKTPNTRKWLKKVSFVTSEYRILAQLYNKLDLSAMFGPRVPVHFVPDTFQARAANRSDLTAAFTTAHITETFDMVEYNEDNFVSSRTKRFMHLVEQVKEKAESSLSTSESDVCWVHPRASPTN